MKLLQTTESRILFATLVAVLIFWYVSPKTNTGNVEEYAEREALLKGEIKRLSRHNEKLKVKDSTLTKAYIQTVDSLVKETERTDKIKIVYKIIRHATDESPDSINLLNEVRQSRVLIDQQEAHIQAFIKLQNAGDSLIKSKILIIQNQDSLLRSWPERFENMVAMKDEEIKQERRQKRKWRAAALFSLFVVFGQAVFAP